MKILVVSRWFAPRNIIGAVRPTQLCKYLAENNNEIVCIAEADSSNSFSDTTLLPVKVIRVSPGRVGSYSTRHSLKAAAVRKITSRPAERVVKKNSLVKMARRFAAQLMHIVDEVEWSLKAFKETEKQIAVLKPDVLITSYGPESSVLIGLAVKKRYPNIKWVSDMRDPMTHSEQSFWRKNMNAHWERKMSKAADAITTVSNALGEKYSCVYGHENVRVFVNGFVPTDSCINLVKQDGILRIGYTGSLYDGKSKMEVLFKAIKYIEHKKGEHVPIELHYAGGDAIEVYKQANCYNASEYIVNHGLLTRDDAQHLQQVCDILCVLSWNTEKEKGVLTGKFPEYLRLKKMILALVTGEVPNAELTKRINDMHCGFSFEYISGDEGYNCLIDWLNKMLALKQKDESISTGMDEAMVEQYSYKYIVNQYAQFLKSLY